MQQSNFVQGDRRFNSTHLQIRIYKIMAGIVTLVRAARACLQALLLFNKLATSLLSNTWHRTPLVGTSRATSGKARSAMLTSLIFAPPRPIIRSLSTRS